MIWIEYAAPGGGELVPRPRQGVHRAAAGHGQISRGNRRSEDCRAENEMNGGGGDPKPSPHEASGRAEGLRQHQQLAGQREEDHQGPAQGDAISKLLSNRG